jgi:FkbM family methyltransferase
MALRPLTSLVRAYVRYFPVERGKRTVYWRLADRFLVWHPHRCNARTVFGATILGDTQDILHRHLYWFGIWEPQLTRFVSRRLRPGDTFVDVGANVGYFTLLASRLVGPSGAVVAVEASPTTYQELRGSLNLNGQPQNVRPLNVAVADREGRVPLFRGPPWHPGLASMFSELEGDLAKEPALEFECEVAARRLDDVLTPVEADSARIVKIDVEGAEARVVAGMGGLLERGRPDLEVVVEIGPERLARQGTSAGAVIREFEQAGFHAYALDNSYRPWSYFDRAEHPPLRLAAPLEAEQDIVFSRVDADRL